MHSMAMGQKRVKIRVKDCNINEYKSLFSEGKRGNYTRCPLLPVCRAWQLHAQENLQQIEVHLKKH